ncbi:hypothetical protein NA57DRAFT_43060, partial [Rhizodiscina lignyota]
MKARRRNALAYPVSLCCTILSLPYLASAHMKMSYPPPLGDPSITDSANADYDETSPLSPDGSDYPCKGFTNSPFVSQATYSAGQTYNMTIAGSASHDGGSCQLSLSYDETGFKVIKSMIGGCPLQTTYDFTIPPDAPSGNALFAWTWENKVGNREFYMNCAQVTIEGPGDDTSNALSELPNIWVANIESVNTCTTTEGVDPMYPHPGCDVEYADGMS